jgi:hypothetical protein
MDKEAVTLTGEKYLVGKRISQVTFIESSVTCYDPGNSFSGLMNSKNPSEEASGIQNKLLVSVWNKEGYVIVERAPILTTQMGNDVSNIN